MCLKTTRLSLRVSVLRRTICSVALLVFAHAPAAHADALALNSTQAAACPSCVADDGGARVINGVLKLAEATGKTVGYDGPTAGYDYAADASRIFSNYTSLDAGDGALTTAQQVAKAKVAGQIVEAGESSGVLPDVLAQAPWGIRSIPVPEVLAGVAAFAAGYGIGTAGKWLVGKLLTGSSQATVGADHWIHPVWRLQPFWDGVNNLHAFDGSSSGPLMPTAHYELQGYYASSSYRYTSFGCSVGSCPGTNTYHTDWLTFERGVSNGHEVVWTSGSTQYTNRIATFGELQRGAPQAMGSLPSGYATVAPVSSLPSRSDVASSVSAYLNSQSDTTTAQWLQHELDPRCSPDPTSTTVVVPTPGAHESATSYKDCLATLGLGVNELVAAPWAVDTSRAAREVTVVDRLGESVSPSDTITFVENPETVPAEVPSPSATDDDDQACALPPGAQNTYLTGLDPFAPFLGSYTSTGTADATDPANFETVRGLTFLLNGEITSFSNWAGWGYRHIYAKHGWSAADEAATREVLATDLAPVHQTPPDFGNAVDRWAFIGNDPHDVYWGTTPGGQKVPCLRVVVVEFGPIDMNQVPNQTGIWTSYGKDLTRS